MPGSRRKSVNGAPESQVMQSRSWRAVAAHRRHCPRFQQCGHSSSARWRWHGAVLPARASGGRAVIDNADEGQARSALTSACSPFAASAARTSGSISNTPAWSAHAEMCGARSAKRHIETVLSGVVARVRRPRPRSRDAGQSVVTRPRRHGGADKLTIETGNADLDERYARAPAEVTRRIR